MKLDEVQKRIREGEAQFIEQPKQEEEKLPEPDSLTKYIAILEVLRRPKNYLTTAPTFTPKNFLEQIQFFDDGADQRIYFYINGSWRYAALT